MYLHALKRHGSFDSVYGYKCSLLRVTIIAGMFY